jgi:diguanylate cyclase (GGDEF)-like protein
MKLDLPTLMVMQSFAIASAGAALLFVWFGNRTVLALAVWGAGHILASAGLLFLLFGSVEHYPPLSALGAMLLSSQASLIWCAARTIDANPVRLGLAALGPAAVGLASLLPVVQEATGSFGLLAGTAYTTATAVTLWHGRNERLIARRPLVALTVVHATSLMVGIWTTLDGATGQDSVPPLLSPFGFIYFESIVYAFGTAIFVLALIKERNEAASRAAASIDSLTGIANRAAFLVNGRRILQRCRHNATPAAVVMFDLDGFKRINDKFGHAVGDAVLRKFCDITVQGLRANDIFGRLGGEEFAVVFPECGIEAAAARADRIRTAFAEGCRVVRGHPVKATVSGGVSVSTDSDETLEVLLERADAALYRAKAMGKNRVNRANGAAGEDRSNVYYVA